MKLALEPPGGINSDETTYATPGVWADGNNMRVRNGRMEAIGGWSKWHSVLLTGTCRNALAWSDDNGQESIACGTHSALQVLVNDTLYDITPTDLLDGNEDTDEEIGGIGEGYIGGGPIGGGELTESWPRTWSLSNFGKWLIANPRGHPIYLWQNDTTAPAAALSGAPTSVICSLVTPSRQVLAFGCDEEVSGDFNAKCIRGSDIETITDWTASTADNAFEFILEGPGTTIVKAALYQDIVPVWTDAALYVGTNQDIAEAPWVFTLTASNCGLIGPNAFTVTNEGVWWMSPDKQFFFWSYGSPPVPVPCPIRDDFMDNLTETDKIVCAENPQFNEIWWFYPDSRDGDECSRFIAYNTAEQAWFRGDVARTAAVDRKGRAPLRINGYIYLHEDGSTADGAALNSSIRSSAFYLDEAGRVVMIGEVKPDFYDQENNITMTIRGRSHAQATPIVKATLTLGPGREKRNMRAVGAIMDIELESTGSWRMGKTVFDYAVLGRR